MLPPVTPKRAQGGKYNTQIDEFCLSQASTFTRIAERRFLFSHSLPPLGNQPTLPRWMKKINKKTDAKIAASVVVSSSWLGLSALLQKHPEDVKRSKTKRKNPNNDTNPVYAILWVNLSIFKKEFGQTHVVHEALPA
ncbi:MAG: hypothetical protein WC445_01320 [Patescibacteria group bacterium]